MPRLCSENQILRKKFTRKGSTYPAKCIRRVSPYLERFSAFQKRVLEKMTRRLRGLSKEKRGNTKKCGENEILRKAYVRYSKSGTRKLVTGACITKRGSSTSGIKIGPIRSGELSKYGYEGVKTMTRKERRAGLTKAITNLGGLSVWKKLNVLYVYNKNKNPALASIFNTDKRWIKNTYGLKVL